MFYCTEPESVNAWWWTVAFVREADKDGRMGEYIYGKELIQCHKVNNHMGLEDFVVQNS